MSDELEKQIEPFTVRDALIQHDKRLNQLTDLSHDTQGVVRNFEEQMKVLLDRINKGVSPTMQQIKDQNSDLKSQIIEFKGDVNTRFAQMNGRMDGQDNRLGGMEEFFKDFKRTAWQVVGSLVLAAIVGLVGIAIWVKSQQSQMVDQLVPTLNAMRSMVGKARQ